MKNKRENNLEERRRRAARNQWIRMGFAMVGCLVLMVAVMYAGVAVFTHLQESREAEEALGQAVGSKDGQGLTDGEGNMLEGASAVVYSQEELDAQIAQAVLEAQTEGYEQALNTIMAGLSQGDTVLETLRPLYPEHMVVASGGQYHFVPINRELAQNQLSRENLNILESGEFQYLEGDQVISHKGIDVSKYQGDIDWSKVAQDGVEFAFIRVGFRGYGKEGKLVEDECFDRNMKGAQSAGIKVGAYFYSQAINEEELREEAQMVLNKLAPYKVQCPVVFDVERVNGDDGRMNNITREERTNLARLFCQIIEEAGYKPMIYHNTEMGALMLDLTLLEDYDKWFASYSDQLYYPYEYKVWQYSQSGKVQGIPTNVDLNISFAPIWTD